MFTNRQKVLHAIIRSPGIVVNIQNMVKNIRKITMQTAKGLFLYLLSHYTVIYGKITPIIFANSYAIPLDELNKLTDEGFGVNVDKNQMEKDKVLDQKKYFSAFIKNDIRDIDIAIFRTIGDTDCDSHTNYDKPMDLVMKKVAVKYHTHPDYLVISPESQPTNSM